MNFSKYIRMDAVNTLINSTPSKKVREDYPTYLSLMITEKGSHLKLLGSSTKTKKEVDGREVLLSVLYLAAYTLAGYGINMCPMAASCAAECLRDSGRMPFHHENRIRKTRAFIAHPVEFLDQLIRDIYIKAQQAMIKDKLLFVRLDGTSDNRWERYLDLDAIVRDFTGLGGFYDYTKFPLKARKPTDHYHLTFSVDEKNVALVRAKEYIEAGYPIAVVAEKQDYKELVKREDVTDGDESDHRWYDTGVVVLKAKRLFNLKYEEAGKGLVRTMKQILELL
tara:strand:+ start:50 stop:889 length:840 start_codon:yes stop_codon:yes gene_type:complete